MLWLGLLTSWGKREREGERESRERRLFRIRGLRRPGSIPQMFHTRLLFFLIMFTDQPVIDAAGPACVRCGEERLARIEG